VPQLLEKMMPFLHPDRGDDLPIWRFRGAGARVARAAGVSAWQFIAPALASAVVLGILANHRLQTRSPPTYANSPKGLEAELFGSAPGGGIQDASGFWIKSGEQRW